MSQLLDKSKWPCTFVIAPEGYYTYFTAGKKYEILRYIPNSIPTDIVIVIIADNGLEIYASLYSYSFINNQDWIICNN